MQQQPYPIENKGTLFPGQTISVNKYTVQVERYLSQGGFSYVYLVRTATLVYNTTHHVLKRIAVPNEAMLTEVKKEVDIMRILKGHPNVVHLIDAAWHRMSNGQYEVFILMEFCPGGGIIDMMNRRLRERLTEAEILQIFVDVLEGVAAMHNLRPALLHRDLKVENILQSSSTSFKLCDFGSATPVALRPPSSTQEIRALEADLNRHTTLQYRPPEMIDPYLRRPIDEKSDVWALGVLLYKLCYYTTPFEEHGPLAILNVQYRIPPYPVYSPQLNGLIVSMLREHGAQRPSVFELLAQVHRMRGTKSRFTYNIPPQQPLSPRTLQTQSAQSLDNLVSYRPSSSTTSNTQRPSPATGAGVHAREKVLEAIAPMRRGRPSGSQQQEPSVSSASRPPTPLKVPAEPPKSTKLDLLDDNFGADEENAWKVMKSSAPGAGDVKPHSSGSAVMSAWKPKGAARAELDATWSVESLTSKVTDGDVRLPPAAFGDNFAEKLLSEFDDAKAGSTAKPPMPADKVAPSKIAPPLEGSRTTKLVITKGKDAFEGLGLNPSVPAPTLGEARKLRTGLAAVNAYNRPGPPPIASLAVTRPKLTSSSARPTPSPRPSLTHQSSSSKASPTIQPAQPPTSSAPPVLPQIGDLSAETRFPSLEELDVTFARSQKPFPHTLHPDSGTGTGNIIDLSAPSTSSIPLRPPQRSVPTSSLIQSGARSEPVTGTVNRDLEESLRPLPSLETGEGFAPSKRPGGRPPSRSSLSRKPASGSSKHQSQDLVDLTGNSSPPLIAPHVQKTRDYKDWLTGDTDGLTSPRKDRGGSDMNPPGTPVLREFTHKRSSFIEENTVNIQSPQEAITGQESPLQVVRVSTPSSPKMSRSSRSKERKQGAAPTRATPATDNKNPSLPVRPLPTPSTRHAHTSQDSSAGPITRPSYERSSSSGDWKPQPALESPRDGKALSSDEESPEDAVGFMASRSTEKSTKARKRRQSFVHDLVDLWGGGVVQTRERRKDPGPDTTTDPTHDNVTKLQRSRTIAMKANTGSPQRLQRPNSGAIELPRSPSRSPNGRSPSSSHVKQMSVVSSPSPSFVAASRGRPQSLFVFPMSKASSDGKSDAPTTPSALTVPQDGSRQNGPRRPSITDMVQRYEAIGRVTASPMSKSAASPGVTSAPLGRTLPQPTPSPAVAKFTPSRVSPASEDLVSAADTDKRQPVSNSRSHYTGQMDRGADPPRGQNSVSGLPTSSSSKILSSNSSQGAIDGLPPGVPNSAVPPEEDPRAPSPEKPYQGVGKLIDQWQRKSEEASRGPTPKRGGFTPRRAGLASGGTGLDN